jgi:hypothetical protein
MRAVKPGMRRLRQMLSLALMTAVTVGLLQESGEAQPAGTNYDESKVPSYVLPDPLRSIAGKPVRDAIAWRESRRPEILDLFARHMYGRTPVDTTPLIFKPVSIDPHALDGLAVRKELAIQLTARTDGPHIHLLLYLPAKAARPVPAFLGLNFDGNHTIQPDPGISLSTNWMRANPNRGIVDHAATEASRGSSASRWPVASILQRGYALITAYYGDLEPDHPQGWRSGVRSIIAPPGPDGFAPEAWGAIGAWAWGLSRIMDYLEQDPDINAQRIALLGHSRLGKAALWAGAQDQRFAIVISNNSGCGGAALSRRQFGETVQRINTTFPHWFSGSFKRYNSREADLPVDQHLLLALIAPRPLYVASAQEDLWADPRGEFLAALHADPVYQLLGQTGLGVASMPEVNQPVGQTIGYHVRSGIHDVTQYDWDQYLQFADRHFNSPVSP